MSLAIRAPTVMPAARPAPPRTWLATTTARVRRWTRARSCSVSSVITRGGYGTPSERARHFRGVPQFEEGPEELAGTAEQRWEIQMAVPSPNDRQQSGNGQERKFRIGVASKVFLESAAHKRDWDSLLVTSK